MAALAETKKAQPAADPRARVILGLLLALFILRIPLVTGYRLLAAAESPDWLTTIFQLGTYLILAVLLVLESNHLQEYFINTPALWIIILFKPVQTIYLTFWTELNSSLALPKIPGLLIWAIAIFLLWQFRARLFTKGAIQWVHARWLLLGSLAGLLAVLLNGYLDSYGMQEFPANQITALTVLLSGLSTIPYQIGYAAISEEPVFRGFLWGYLRKSGWRDGWIWLFQAVLFALAHLYYLPGLPVSFWVSVPFGGILLGWLAWRSRSIATSMLAHGVINGLSRSFAIIITMLR